jgi:hypothetical protein
MVDPGPACERESTAEATETGTGQWSVSDDIVTLHRIIRPARPSCS